MKKSKILAIFGIISVLSLLSTGTFAYFTAQAEVENSLTTGTVALEVRQRDENGKDISEDGDKMAVMPGDTAVYSAFVENTGSEPVYLRVKLVTEVAGGETEGLTEEEKDCLEPAVNTKAWTEKDGYYYYNEVLQPGEDKATEPLFTSVHFNGAKMGNAYLGSRLSLRVQAYGVQSRNNVAVDGDHVADLSDRITWPEIPADAGQIPAVSYYGRAKQFVFTPGTEENPADLFGMFKGLAPGDEREQEIMLRSAAASGAPVNLFLRAYVPAPDENATEKEKEDAAKAEAFLKRITMNIRCDEFSDRPMLEAGAYPDQRMDGWIFLGRFAYNTTGILRVTVKVPADLANTVETNDGDKKYTDNDFQGLEAKVRWAFLVEEFDVAAGGGGSGTIPENPTPGTPETKTPETETLATGTSETKTPTTGTLAAETPAAGALTEERMMAVNRNGAAGNKTEGSKMEETEDLPMPLAPPVDQRLGIPEEEVPLAEWGKSGLWASFYKFLSGMAELSKSDSWALVNSIFMSLTVFESMLVLFVYYTYTRKEEEEEQRKCSKDAKYCMNSVFIAAVSLVIFLLTEDLTKPMGLVDLYTPVMLVLAAVQTIVIIRSKVKQQ